MKRQKISRAMNYLDDTIIVDAMNEKSNLAYQGGYKMKVTNLWKKWAAAAAVFTLMLGAVIAIVLSIGSSDATIAFDVNPSIEIKLGSDERVKEIKALNEDGKIVIGNMDFKDVELNVAINAIIGSMLNNGYLSIEQNSILISVDTRRSKNADKLRESISESVSSLLSESDIDACVITQSYSREGGAKEALIEKILATGVTNADGVPYTKEQLFRMNVNELKLMLESKGTVVGGISFSGTASEAGYIGKEQALSSALSDAGFTKDEVEKIKIELDFEDDIRKMVYEVEFVMGEYEYEYAIIADIRENGKIIDKEIDFADEDDDDFFFSDGKDSGPIPEGCISKEEAIEKALAHAGLKREDVREIDCEFEREFLGRLVYEIDFEANGYEYEYKLNAESGEIIRSHSHRDD